MALTHKNHLKRFRLAVKNKDLPIRSTDNAVSPDWQKIQTHDQKTGYVATQYLRSPIDYRAGFDKGPDGWKMTFFVAGD